MSEQGKAPRFTIVRLEERIAPGALGGFGGCNNGSKKGGSHKGSNKCGPKGSHKGSNKGPKSGCGVQLPKFTLCLPKLFCW